MAWRRQTCKSSAFPFDLYSQSVARGVGETLANAEVAFGRENGFMPEGKLDPFEGRSAAVGELGEGAAEIVGGNGKPELFGVTAHNQIDGLGGNAVAFDFPALGDGPE
jgi:hypothetical protein